MLRDAAGLTLLNFGFADSVEQRGFAVIDVAHDGHHRRTRDEVFLIIRDILSNESIFRRLLLFLLHIDAKFSCYQSSGIVVNFRVDGAHHAKKHELFDDLGHRFAGFLRKRFDGDRIPSHRDIRHHDRLEALRSLLHLIGLALARTHAEFFVDIDVLILDARTLALALGVIIIRTLFLIIMQVGLRNDRRELASLLGFRTICRGTACWRIPILIFVKTAGIIPAALSTLIPTRTLAALITARALPIGAIPCWRP